MKLYKHNKEAYEAVKEFFINENKAALVHATGTGKMYIALQFLIDNKDSEFVYVAPSRAILNKFMDILVENISPEHYEKFKKLSYEVKLKRLKLKNIKLLTYQKLAKLSDEEMMKINPKNIVIDEFHHASAPKWGVGVEKLLKYNSDAKVLGLTATPIRSDGVNALDKLFNGKVVSVIDLKDAFEREILKVPYYFGAIYSFKEELEKDINHFNKKNNLLTEERNEAIKIIKKIKNNIKEGKGIKDIFDKGLEVSGISNPRYIVFTKDIEDLNNKIIECKDWFSKDVEIYSIHSKQDENKNIKEIHEFENSNSDKVKLLFSIDKLNEGLHISNVDGVIMLRPTQSNIVFSQQIGRALSLTNSEKTIVYDLVNNLNGFYDSREFITNIFAKIKNEGVKNKYNHNIDFSLQEKTIDLFNRLKKIIYSYQDEIEILKQYKDEFGSIADILYGDIYKDVSIGNLIAKLRARYKKGLLDSYQIKQLEDLGMIWNKNIVVSYEDKIAILKEYAKEYGSIRNIVRYDEYKGYKVGIWISQFRILRKELPLEMKKVLEDLGIVWEVRTKNAYEEKIEILSEYVKENNTIADVKHEKEYKGYKIGKWISKFKNIKDKLPIEIVNQLDELGMVWEKNGGMHIDKKMKILKEYVKENNTIADVKYEKEYKGYEIGKWVSRFKYIKDKLPIEIVNQLDELGIVWEKNISTPFATKIKILKEYVKENGNTLANVVTKDKYKGYTIGIWVGWFRLKKNELSKEKIEALEELGVFDVKENRLMKNGK